MIIHRLAPKKGIVVLTPEDGDDLWCVRRILEKGCLVTAMTSRLIKSVGSYSRPDRGERVRAKLTIRVDSLRLDNELSRLRITGPIVEASDEVLPKGSYHSLTVSLGRRVGLRKDRLSDLDLRLLRSAREEDEGFMIVAVDRREAGIGVVKGTRLQLYPSVTSGLSGKFYGDSGGSLRKYYDEVADAIFNVYDKGMRIFFVGPGRTKNVVANHLISQHGELQGAVSVIEGPDVAGEDGVYTSLRSSEVEKAVERSKIARVARMLKEAVKRISMNDPRVALSFRDTLKAAKLGAVESALISDKIFEVGVDDADLVELLNVIEDHRGRAYLIDSSTDLGAQVSTLGGVVALLRFAVAGA